MTNEEAIEYAKLTNFCAGCTDYECIDDNCEGCIQKSFFELVIEALEKQTKHCDNCKYLIVWNDNDMYAECEINNFKFKSFDVDTRETYCNYWESE